jgi:hypothetical protein
MSLCAPRLEKMVHARAPQDQRVGDQSSVASPPHRLRAQDRERRRAPRRAHKFIDGGAEPVGIHVLREGPEGRDSQCVMSRHAPRIDRAAPSERVAAPGVPDPVIGQAPRQRLAAEVRVPPGAGEPADVDDATGARGLQDDDELREGSSPVPDGE